ncbi:hypothetical protein PQC16_gp066 [Rhizobium phage RHph_TM30]|uniref:Uncharacterized protein n=1 Tax=Rhizobium phage RHph_TM30 TaxID=2509764 RepID=A0A7S5R4V5_9CAUD|nr:hypothetical protein PQC16_gp066 [Rhizobium phage RHph_TM30]QIG71173.1 hypothetical protein EVB93_066 [Rhizobium phage RHph_TM30]QIG77393.1 hypothetical protein EVB61_065 [Rhizobium phage RHph_TM21B]QIG77653.1 hypothetical protein EVB64_066 [Rhizobium phage RHph_TM61]
MNRRSFMLGLLGTTVSASLPKIPSAPISGDVGMFYCPYIPDLTGVYLSDVPPVTYITSLSQFVSLYGRPTSNATYVLDLETNKLELENYMEERGYEKVIAESSHGRT